MLKKNTTKQVVLFLYCLFVVQMISAQLVHPGLAHKKSDLDRMKYMVEAKVDPWYATYLKIANDSKSSYNYSVQGNTSMTEVYRDDPYTNKSEFESDSRAAQYNAFMWYITGDARHAEKAIEVFNAWTGLTYVQHYGTHTLTASMVYIMLEAAEIIRHTYDGWSASDIKKFEDMLVYPGYSNTQEPDDLETQGTWYWRTYKGDNARAGNQELSGWRAIMALGVFLDNEIIYDRALRYISGLPHRSDDLPYYSGPNEATSIITETPYNIAYNFEKKDDIEDYGFEGVLTNYIYETGQNAESSRDQGHAGWGLNLLNHLAEIAWNQGDNLYDLEDRRLLLGLEHYNRYNLSYVASYADQTEPWEPTVANGFYVSRLNRVARTKCLAINPYFEYNFDGVSRGTKQTAGYWELPTNHYVGRGIVTEEEAKWLVRTRDYAVEKAGWEGGDGGASHVGWGGLTFRRPTECYGEPISGFASNGLPSYNLHILPGVIEAENYDYTPFSAEGRTYHDVSTGNSGNQYRNTEDVDIEECSEGGYNVGWIENGEWLSYTLFVPTTGTYDISLRYASTHNNGQVQFRFDGFDTTNSVALPSTNGADNWQTANVASVKLIQGVQSMRILFSTDDQYALNLNYISIEENTNVAAQGDCGSSFDAYNIIEVENYCDQSGTVVEENDTGITNVGRIDNGDWLKFDDVDFGSEGPKTIQVSGSSNNSDNRGSVEFRLGSTSGTLIGTIEIQNTKGWQTYLKHIVDINNEITGVHDLYLVFTGNGGSLFNLDWFRFISSEIKENVLSNEEYSLLLEEIVKIYPNPTADYLNINFEGMEAVSVQVYNMKGQLFISKEINNKQPIDLQSLNTGLYIVKFVKDNKFFTKTIVKR